MPLVSLEDWVASEGGCILLLGIAMVGNLPDC